MSIKQFRNISQLNHLFSIGQEVYYSCLIPDYDWFDKKFSINELIEPVKLEIMKHDLVPHPLSKSDDILIYKLKILNVVRKYFFHIGLEDDNSLKLIVYETINKEVVVLYETNKIITYDVNEMTELFMKRVIMTKRDIDFDSELIINNDDNYKRFVKLYTEAVELYPEEVIKLHDFTRVTVR